MPVSSAREFYKELSSFGDAMPPGPDADKQWLKNAEQDCVRLLTQREDGLVMLYASFRYLLIVSVFVPTSNLDNPDKTELYNARIHTDDAWCIQKAYGGGQGHRMYLEPPLNFGGDHPLQGAEPIVFRRSFDGMPGFPTQIEISQKLVHALGLHFVQQRNAFCRLDREGDIEEVIHVFQDEGTGNFDNRACVLINSKALSEYMAVGNFSLFRKFDITRFPPDGSFSNWDSDVQRWSQERPDLFYNAGQSAEEASYIHGGQILRPDVTLDQLIDRWKRENDPNARKYESFIIHDWKNDRVVEWSSAPNALSNYFTKSEKPFELSPAYFRPEVLTKYKADPDKYELRDQSIACRNSWYLKTYDLNKAGQVHTYIIYLQNLPYREQQHWKLYNEPPEGGLSKRAIETDFKGEWSSEEDPLQSLRHAVDKLDRDSPKWWSRRGQELQSRVHYPITTSSKEWADELQSLDQMLVEGFVATELRNPAKLGASIERDWRSLRIIQELLRSRGFANAADIVAPLRYLHHLRSKVPGHHTSERKQLEEEAFEKHGSLAAHFRQLCSDCSASFAAIIEALHEMR
jgi:hypothetical protein